MDIVERLRTEAPSYVLIGDAAVEIERLRDALQDVLAKEYVVDCKDVAHAALKEKKND